MFTGLIEGVGKVSGVQRSHDEMRLTLIPPFDTSECQIGESISVNGVCLTVTGIKENSLSMDVSGETLSRSTLRLLKGGDAVNLERALRLTDRLGGHLVTGHIDGPGFLKDKKRVGNAEIITFGVAGELAAYMVPKGSVAVDGISLTINRCGHDFLM